MPRPPSDPWLQRTRDSERRRCALAPANRMVSDGYHRITYAQHQKRVYQLASALSAWGVNPGDRIGTFMWNTGRHLQCYHALPSMGCVMHTINIRLSPAELGYIITHAEDRVILCDEDLLPLLEEVPQDVLDSVGLFVICGTDEKAGARTHTRSSPLPLPTLLLLHGAAGRSAHPLCAPCIRCYRRMDQHPAERGGLG